MCMPSQLDCVHCFLPFLFLSLATQLSFSKFKLIKMCESVAQSRFNMLSLLAIDSDFGKKLDTCNLIDTFAKSNQILLPYSA